MYSGQSQIITEEALKFLPQLWHHREEQDIEDMRICSEKSIFSVERVRLTLTKLRIAISAKTAANKI
jgi:hypothetical protein